MKALVCEMCGSHDFIKQDGMYVCQHCNTKYTAEEAKNLFVAIDNSSKIENLIKVARQAQTESNFEKAGRYYDMVLQEQADNWEAAFYTVYDSAMGTNIAGISSAAYSIGSCLPNVLQQLKKDGYSKEQENDHLGKICVCLSRAGASFYQAALTHYKKYQNATEAGKEMRDRVNAIIAMLFFSGDCFESYFDGNEPLIQNIMLGLWEEAVTCYESTPMIKPEGFDAHVEKIKKYKPDFSYRTPSASSGGCYIATCVYGSYDCPPVWTLRRFRDGTLAKTWYGRAFIKAYYAVSPKLVKYFGGTSWFKRFWKVWLDRMVLSLQRNGFDSSVYIDK